MSDETNLTGSYHVRAVMSALVDAEKLLPRTKDRMVLRRHALKLRYWPSRRPETEHGQLLDLNWSWIKALKGSNVGELRVDDVIGDHDNLRLIFFVPGIKRTDDLFPTLWVLAAMQKKRNEFTHAQIANFKARRTVVLERFFTGRR